MARVLSSLHELLDHGFDDVIDVRSPDEFGEDHVPGAVSLPVLSNAERARVGTIYKQDSPFRARKVGAALVARNAAAHLETALADKPGDWRPLVYCWRGGQRSGAFATILQNIGWRAETLEGGYKAYRRMVVAALYDAPFPLRLVTLDGNTGSGKTAILARLKDQGVQMIDLEGLACHRGSLLGACGDQPSQKAFESALTGQMARIDPARPVVVEAESSKIGRLILPPALLDAMRVAPRVELRVPVEARARFLAETYGAEAGLADRITLLQPLLGTAAVTEWADRVRAGDLEAVAAELVGAHYDRAYAKSRGDKEPAGVIDVAQLDDAGLEAAAGATAELIKRL